MGGVWIPIYLCCAIVYSLYLIVNYFLKKAAQEQRQLDGCVSLSEQDQQLYKAKEQIDVLEEKLFRVERLLDQRASALDQRIMDECDEILNPPTPILEECEEFSTSDDDSENDNASDVELPLTADEEVVSGADGVRRRVRFKAGHDSSENSFRQGVTFSEKLENQLNEDSDENDEVLQTEDYKLLLEIAREISSLRRITEKRRCHQKLF